MKDAETADIVANIARHPHLVTLISKEVSDEVDSKIRDRENRQLKFIAAITTMILFIGFGGITAGINLATRNAVEKAVSQRSLEFQPAILQATVSTILAKAEIKESFTNADRDQIMSSFERLAEMQKQGVFKTNSAEFSPLLERAIDVLASSNNNSLVNRLFDLYESDCLNSQGIVTTLALHYGQLSISGSKEIRDSALERFQRIEETAETHKLFPVVIAHRLLIEAQASKSLPSVESVSLIKQVAILNDADKEIVWKLWQRYATGCLINGDDPQEVPLEDATRKLIAGHRQLLQTYGFTGELQRIEAVDVNCSI